MVPASPVLSFSAFTPKPSSFTATDTTANNNNNNHKLRKLEESFAEWTETHKAYLQKHQVTHYRKSAGRAWNVFRKACVSCGSDFLVWTLQPFHLHNITTLTAVAQHMVQTLPNLGPTYVKVGQALATRPDLLPSPVDGGVGEGLADALLQLHDDVPPFDNRIAKAVIRRECLRQMRNYNRQSAGSHPYFANNVTAVQSFLDTLSEQPHASASMSQVYKGYLSGFGPVAVKVQ
jgi:predicted unusual protein kinase regulating ubiquinone biosynthesis (AarF/ABC1/UbiB family)